MVKINNTPPAPVAEEIVIEQAVEETTAELREKLKVLQDELKENEEENDELNKLVWEGIEKLGKEKGEKKELRTRLNSFKKIVQFLIWKQEKKKRIDELNSSLSFLRGLLTEKKEEVINLTTQNNNLQNQINDLNQQLVNANTLIANKNNEITRLGNKAMDVEKERDSRPKISLHQWDSDYNLRPTKVELNSVQQQLTQTQSQLANLQQEESKLINKISSLEASLRATNNDWRNGYNSGYSDGRTRGQEDRIRDISNYIT